MARLKIFVRNGTNYVRLFHSTSEEAAKAIMLSGFRDSRDAFIANLRGVFFSDRPLDDADGVAKHNNVVIAIECTTPPTELRKNYEVKESGRPKECYREWLIPSEVANSMNRYIHIVDENE